MPQSEVLRCVHCGTPIAEIQGGVLVIRSKHHGQQHINLLRLEDLKQKMEATLPSR